jgi:hypothetical protein
MFRWLERLFSAGPHASNRRASHRAPEDHLAAIEAALEQPKWQPEHVRTLCGALDGLCAGDGAAFEEHLPWLRQRLARWYAEHPFEVQWGRDYRFEVIDPLRITTDEIVPGSEEAALAPWATLLRSFELVTGGPNIFHHGCDLGGLLELLADPAAPAQVQRLSLPFLLDHRAVQVDELVERLCHDKRFASLRHLALGTSHGLEARHIERLTTAPWAGSLRTLDLSEVMVDWGVDCPEQLHHVLPMLRRFESLTHLFMYNNVHGVADVAALLEASLPALTHLNLGGVGDDAEVLERIAAAESFPKLQELCLAGGPHRMSSGWDRIVQAPFSVYLHGKLVTPEYPKRTP